MTYFENSTVRSRTTWSELARRYPQQRQLQRRYCCLWVVATLIPFTLLRMTYLSSIKDQSTGIIMVDSEEHSYRLPTFTSGISSDAGLEVKSSTSHARTHEDSYISFHERVSVENSFSKRHGKKIIKEKKRKSKGQDGGMGHYSRAKEGGYRGLPLNNEKLGSMGMVMVEKQETPDKKQEEKQEQQQEEKQTREKEHEGKQDEKPSDTLATSSGKTATAEERRGIEGKDYHRTGATKEKLDTRSEMEFNEREADEQKGIYQQVEDKERDGNQEKAIEMRNGEQMRSAEEGNLNDGRQGSEQLEVATGREAEERREAKRKVVEAIEEKREEEELKGAERMERAQIVEEQIQATETEKAEEKHQDGGAVTVQEVKDHTQEEQSQESMSTGLCDLFEGDWVWDPEDPLYTNASCFYMQSAQNCMSNGRPDSDYLHWKWKPRDCALPRFDARAFLVAFKGKTIAFVGDSLARNQMQSLLCMLSQIEVPKLMYQSHDDGTVRWLYEQHQVTLRAVWSPYLLKESTEGIMGFEKGQSVLYLDVLDTAWTSVMQDFDIMVLSIGQWYFKASIYVREEKVVGCHCCPGVNFTKVGYPVVYEGAVRKVLEEVASEFKGIAVMSTFAISHFEDGPWENGGQCRREKPLDREEGAKFPGQHNEMHDIVMGEFSKIAHDRSKVNEGVRLEFLDVTKISLTRADGHPGPYRRANPYEGKNSDEWVPNDCLHWCLPGPVDTWNQLLVKLVHRHL